MELNDSEAQQGREPESEPTSTIVSFPDRYLIPYIEWCKRSRRITCSCSLMFIGLAIFCFFATNYMINYPVTESRKIAFVFAGVFCLVAAISCLDLRFRILNQCRNEPSNNTLFEITRREDTAFSDSFSGHFEMQSPIGHGTPKEGPSQSETPDDSSSVAHSDNESFRAHFTAFRNSERGRLPRHSVSNGQSPTIPLLPLRRSVELSRPTEMLNAMNSTRLPIGTTVPGYNSYPPNYSTFERSQLVLVDLTIENGSEASETEPLLAESSIENACEVTETEPLLAEPTFENGCDVYEREHQLAEPSFVNGCEASETEPLLARQLNEYSSEATDTEPLLAEQSYENGREAIEINPLLAGPSSENSREASETEPLLAQQLYEYSREATDTEPLLAEQSYENGREAIEINPLLVEPSSENSREASATENLLAELTFEK